jgi:hypothetical protein
VVLRICRVLLVGTVAAVATLGAIAAPALAAAPAVTTGANAGVTYQSASLFGTVHPGGESTEVYFQYGPTNKYGAQSAPTQLPAGTKAVEVSIAIAGLSAGTTYHYRFVATNATGTALGADRTLVTAKIPLSLAITAAPNPVEFGSPVTIEGTLTGTGSAGAAVQLQQNVFPYTAGFVNIGNAELTLPTGGFVFNVLGVALNTEYRVVSGNVASVDVPVSVGLSVTMHTRATGTHKRPTVRFSGTIAPAEPSARIAFERLVGTSWKTVGGTVAQVAVTNGVVSFAKTLRIYHSGFFRALVLPVEGAHVSGYSPTDVVRLK